MKAFPCTISRLIRGTFLLSLILCTSCGTVYFDSPQPVDSKNLKAVPEEIRGTWKTKSKNVSTSSIYEEVIKIDKKSFSSYSADYYSIARSEIDTSTIYKLSEGKIVITRSGTSHSYPYRILNDSILFSHVDNERAYRLSDSVLLRKAKGCYIANIKNGEWWEIVFIQKLEGGDILIIYPLDEDLSKMKHYYNLTVLDSTKRDSIFFHADFKSKNIINVINKEATIYTLLPDSTFETSK